MTRYQVKRIRSLCEFRESTAEWNSLWVRSFTDQPTVRAEAIEHWVRTFSDSRSFTAITVACAGRLVAAIPLVRNRRSSLPFHQLPVNCWSHNGDLLLDRELAQDEVLETLIDGVQAAGIKLLTLEDISIASEQWSLFQAVLERRGQPSFLAGQRPVGVINTLGNWPAYTASWSSKFRSSLNRNRKQLDRLGTVNVTCHRNPDPDAVAAMMMQAFTIEDSSWKGTNGSSILRTPAMADYMIEEARLMIDAGTLDLWFLSLNGKPIAFEYCHLAKGVCFCHKIGFDPEHRSLAPGKVLRYDVLRRYHEDSECDLFDTLGLFCPLKAKWATRTYQVGRLYVPLGSPLTEALVRSFSLARPWIRKIRGEVEPPQLQPAAQQYLQTLWETAPASPTPAEPEASPAMQGKEVLL